MKTVKILNAQFITKMATISGMILAFSGLPGMIANVSASQENQTESYEVQAAEEEYEVATADNINGIAVDPEAPTELLYYDDYVRTDKWGLFEYDFRQIDKNTIGVVITGWSDPFGMDDSLKTNVNIPDTLRDMPVISVEDVYSLGGSFNKAVEFIVSPSSEYLATIDGVLFNKKTKTLVAYPDSKQGKRYDIPDKIKGIGAGAFADSNLTEVNIPDSVETIGNEAFESLYAEEIKLPANLKVIGHKAFYRAKIKAIEIPDGVEIIGENAFGSTGISSLVIPATVYAMGDGVFTGCEDLASIEVEEGNPCFESVDHTVLIDKIGRKIMGYVPNSADKEYIIPEGIIGIRGEAFRESGLEQIQIPDSVTMIGRAAFYSSDIKEITVPGSVTEIRRDTFAYCDKLHRVELQDGVSCIDMDAFDSCENLEEVVIPASVNDISKYAFDECPKTMVLVVEEGSYAEEFAKLNGITYKYVNSGEEDLSWLDE